MKLYHFYIDSDKLLFPVCRNKLGYGIFYWYIDNLGFIKSVDYQGKNIRAYFENGENSIKNFDANIGRFGENKLQETSDSQYVQAAIKQIFENKGMLNTIKMWDNI